MVLAKPRIKPVRNKAKKSKRRAAVELALPDGDASLFEHLRQLRTKLAQENNVPAYMVFGDKSLMHMAAESPQSERDFLGIHGVGEVKCAKYGEAFLEAIRTFQALG